MLRLASDADVHGAIVRGRRRKLPELDLVRVQDALPEGVRDPDVLAWAAEHDRVVLTNDRSTMIGFARQRAVADEPFAGLIATTVEQSIGGAIDDLSLIVECLTSQEMRELQVIFLPL